MELQDTHLIRLLADFKEHLSADMQHDLKVPSIVVLGAENSGKSSLLSRIIGMNILPVKNGVCTKCPIEVTVLNNPSLEGKFKLSISYEEQERLRDEEKSKSIKIEQYSFGSAVWKEYDSPEEMRDEVTTIVEDINKRRKTRNQTLNKGDFSSESIKILVESNEFKKNNDFVKEVVGERWKSRVVGVITKIDEGSNAEVAENILNGKDGFGLRWFGVINKSDDKEASFKEIGEYEATQLKNLLGHCVEEKKLGIDQLRQYLANELIFKMKDLLRGDKFRDTIKKSLTEVTALLDNEPQFVPFSSSGYIPFIEKVSTSIKGGLLGQDIFATLLKDEYEKIVSGILGRVILTQPFHEYYKLVDANARQSGGIEKSVGVTTDLPRKLLVEPRMRLHKDTMEFLQEKFKGSMELLRNYVESNTDVGKEDQDFKAYFLARLRCDEAESSYTKQFENVKSIVETMFKASENTIFPGNYNFISIRYSLYTTRAYRMSYETMNRESAEFKQFINELNHSSPDQKVYGNAILEFGKTIAEEPLDKKKRLSEVMEIVIGQISTLAYLLTEMVPALLHRILLEGTYNLAETFNPHKMALGVYYDREKRAKYDFYHDQKPYWERKKNGLMELKKKYPEIL